MGGAIVGATNGLKFSISNMSLLPNTMIPGGYGLQYLRRVIEVAGYDSVHLDPLWTLSKTVLTEFPSSLVSSVKPSWRENWYDDRTDSGRIKNGELPDLLMDISLFGTRDRARHLNHDLATIFPEAIQVDMAPGGVLQLSENHALSLDGWRQYPGGVELPSYHIRHLPDFVQGEQCNEDACLEFAQNIGSVPGLVRQIHVQIRGETELHRFFHSKRTFTQEFLEAISSSGVASRVPILVTVSFQVLPRSFQGRVDVFKELRQCIKDCL